MADRVISYDFRGKFTNLTAGLASAGASVNAFGTKLTALDKNGSKMRAGLTQLGGVAGKVGLAAAAGLGAMVLVTAKFDKAMSNVAATGEDARGSLDALRQAALDAGAATSFSATEAASGIENLLKAGISAKDVLGGGLSGALDLAAAGSLDVAAAAEIAATAMTQFSLSGDDVGHVADLLSAGAGKAQGDVSDMGMALKQSGLVAAQVGLTIEETTGTLAAFASAGLIGSDAGTSFKTMLQSLTPSGDKARRTMEELGITAYDAQGNFVGMTEFAASLQNGLKDLSVEQQNAAMKTIFGSDAVRAAAVIFEQGAGGVQKWIDNVNDSGYAAEVAGQKLDNLAGDWENLTGALETALIGSGEGSTGILRGMTQGVTDLVNAFNDLPSSAKNATTGLLAITAITGGALWFGSKVVGGIASTKLALDQLGISAARTSTLMAGLGKGVQFAAIGISLKFITDELERMMDMNLEGDINRNLEALTNGEVTGNLDKMGNALADFTSGWEKNWGRVNTKMPFTTSAWEEAEEKIKTVDDALASMVESGNVEQAAAAFEQLVAMGVKEGASAEDAAAAFEQYGIALDNLGASAAKAEFALVPLPGYMDEGSAAAAFYAEATQEVASAAEEEAEALRDSVKAMRAKTDATLAAFDAETQYRQALKEARAQANKNEAGIRGNSEAALNNRNALSQLASAWNNQSDAVKNNVKRFRESRSAFIETATAMGVPEKAAERLAAQILDIPRSRAIRITAETAAANAAIEETRRRLVSINGFTATTYVRIQRLGDAGIGPGRNDPNGSADGGSVPKTGLPYADRHPYLLADGEEVISNRFGQADRHRGLLKAINAGRLADGGTAGRGARGGDGNDLPNSLKGLTRALKEAEKALDRETKQRDNLISKRGELASGIRSGLGGDIWEGPTNPWAAGATSNPTDALNAQFRDAREFTKLIKSLKSKGLDGAALAEVASSGDIERARMMAALSSSDLRSFETAYNRTQRAIQAAGSAGGQAVYGAQIAAQTKELQTVNAELRAIKQAIKAKEKNDHKSRENAADRTTRGVNGAAGGGRRDRVYADR